MSTGDNGGVCRASWPSRKSPECKAERGRSISAGDASVSFDSVTGWAGPEDDENDTHPSGSGGDLEVAGLVAHG